MNASERCVFPFSFAACSAGSDVVFFALWSYCSSRVLGLRSGPGPGLIFPFCRRANFGRCFHPIFSPRAVFVWRSPGQIRSLFLLSFASLAAGVPDQISARCTVSVLSVSVLRTYVFAPTGSRLLIASPPRFFGVQRATGFLRSVSRSAASPFRFSPCCARVFLLPHSRFVQRFRSSFFSAQPA
jgi:hypothetical protein